jgi:uncharacterized protein YkwD
MLGGKSDGRWLIPVALIAAVAAFTFLFATHASVFGGSDAPPARPAAQARDGSVEKDAVTPQATPTTQPSLLEILQAADALAKAGVIPTPVPAPTEVPLIDILRAADALAKAGALPQPSPTEVPLIDILRAADALAKAGKLPGQSQPPAPPIAPPPASAPLPPEPTPTSAPPPPPAPQGDGGWYDYTYIGRVWDLINQQRVSAGLQPVTKESRLTLAAAGYARVLSDQHWFSHTGPDGSTLVSRITGAGFPFNVPIGEILAWGTQAWPADAMVQAWMNSPTHRSEILSGDYTRAGLSCYFLPSDGVTVHCVMDFAG